MDPDDQVDVWIWDTSQQIPRRQRLAADDASFLAAARSAEQLHAIDPDNASFQQMYLATGLEVAKRLNGYDRPLTDEAGTFYQDATAGKCGTARAGSAAGTQGEDARRGRGGDRFAGTDEERRAVAERGRSAAAVGPSLE